jgi:glycosyltransferase
MLVPAMHQLVAAKGLYGLAETPLQPDVEITISPESAETNSVTPDSIAPPALAALPMRHCADNGGAQLPSWLLRTSDRPRVAVTVGSIPSTDGEGALLAKIIEAAAELDVELVVTPVPQQLPALPDPLPSNVRTVSWLPVSALLPTCALAVHHGGMGTTYVALASGLPQLIIPVSGDQPYNAQTPQRLGVGELIPLADATAESIAKHMRNLLELPSYRTESERVAQEMRDMPTPASVLGRLVELFG